MVAKGVDLFGKELDQITPNGIYTFDSRIDGFRVIDEAFVEIGIDLLCSEELTDRLYSVFLLLVSRRFMCDGFTASNYRFPMDHLLPLLDSHIYMPCVKRLVIPWINDWTIDPLEDIATYIHFESGQPFINTAMRLPNGWRPKNRNVVPHRRSLENYFFRQFYAENDSDLMSFGCPVSCLRDGRVLPYHNAFFGHGSMRATLTLSTVFAAYADRRHLWQVRVKDESVKYGELLLGVGPQEVKSLMLARNSPLTETGRRRPILHWVREHQRRIAAGDLVDVRQHLRGTESFSMHGLDFNITEPTKNRSISRNPEILAP